MSGTDHFSTLPPVPHFTVTSTSVKDGEPLALPQWSGRMGVPGGQDRSPHLSWSDAPEGTKSYAVTVYDVDAPTGSGFWHWAVADIPAEVTELAEGVDGAELPAGAIQLPNDARDARFVGAVPPPGHGPHRLVITVHALDVETIGIPAEGTPAYLGYLMSGHTLGRATIVATAEAPGAG
jgi:Raf kinase inhibitor-like YbhB/YbcL family protein